MHSQQQFGFAGSPRDNIKGILGEFLGRLFPEKFVKLREHPRRDDDSFMNRLLLQGLVRKCTREGDLDVISQIHRNEWKEGNLESFFENTRDRFEDWFLQSHVAVIDELEAAQSNNDWPMDTIVEIGCGAGQVITYLADRFPQANRLVGLDICENQIEQNRSKNSSEKIEYFAGNALDWIVAHAEPNTVFISNGGVLEYFSPSELDKLFQRVRSLERTMLVTIEPIAIDHNLKTTPEAKPFGNERSFSHNYPNRLKAAGFDVIFDKDIPTDEYRFLLLLSRPAV